MDSLGRYLKDLRERRSLSVRKAASLLDLSSSRLGEIEKGESYRTLKKTRPSPQLLGRMAQLYGVSEDSLLEMSGHKAPDAEGRLSSESRMVVEMFEQLSPERRELAIAMLRVFLTSKSEA